jgi:TRAP-type C4-dicarboxylate transport system permease small subunit
VEKAYALWRAFQEKILGQFAALLLLGCTLLALIEVYRRYVIGLSYEWQADAVTFFILSGVFLFFGISQRTHSHLSVELLVSVLESLGPRARRAAEIIRLVALVVSCAFLLAVVWWGIPEIEDSLRYGTRTESLQFWMWPFLLALLVGFAFTAITMMFQIYRSICKLRGLDVLVDPPEEEAKLH